MEWTRSVKGENGATLFVDLIPRKPALSIRRMAGGLVNVELDEVRDLVDVLSQAAADLAAMTETRVDEPWDTFESVRD